MLCQKHLCCCFKLCHQLLSLETGQLHEYHFYRPCNRFYCGISICFLLLFFVHFYHYSLYPIPSLGLPLVCPFLSLWNRFSSDFHSTFNTSSSFLFSLITLFLPSAFTYQHIHAHRYFSHVYAYTFVYTCIQTHIHIYLNIHIYRYIILVAF